MAKRPKFTREQSLDAKPIGIEITRREPLRDGGQRLVITVPSRGWTKRILRMPDNTIRKFDLDPFGVDLFDLCDGQKSVRHIIKRFARDHDLDPIEAEQAVATFLRTLIRKGLVHMMMPKR
ncbi:MAG: hypothetical protein CMJ49_13775 [Planctomycetaceae bacterium]|nr:hypothetical protein [Planctomycetaceae bacterium]